LEKTIKLLIRLQDCDLRIRKITQKQAEGPLIIQRLADGIKEAEEKLETAKENLAAAQKGRRGHEQGIEELRGKIQKSNVKLSNIKSNKEYTAVLKEIDDLKKEMGRQEDALLEIMEELEHLERDLAVATREHAAAMEKRDNQEAQIKSELRILESELSELAKERESFIGSVDGQILQRYIGLMNHRGGPALSSVLKGVCQMCRLHIPPQKFNELIRGEAIMSCPNCHRIIYWGEDERFQDLLDAQ